MQRSFNVLEIANLKSTCCYLAARELVEGIEWFEYHYQSDGQWFICLQLVKRQLWLNI